MQFVGGFGHAGRGGLPIRQFDVSGNDEIFFLDFMLPASATKDGQHQPDDTQDSFRNKHDSSQYSKTCFRLSNGRTASLEIGCYQPFNDHYITPYPIQPSVLFVGADLSKTK